MSIKINNVIVIDDSENFIVESYTGSGNFSSGFFSGDGSGLINLSAANPVSVGDQILTNSFLYDLDSDYIKLTESVLIDFTTYPQLNGKVDPLNFLDLQSSFTLTSIGTNNAGLVQTFTISGTEYIAVGTVPLVIFRKNSPTSYTQINNFGSVSYFRFDEFDNRLYVGDLNTPRSVKVYTFNGTSFNGSPSLTINSPDPSPVSFGDGIDVSNNYLIISDSVYSKNSKRGVVYKYIRNGTGWNFLEEYQIPSGSPSAGVFGVNCRFMPNDSYFVCLGSPGVGNDVFFASNLQGTPVTTELTSNISLVVHAWGFCIKDDKIFVMFSDNTSLNIAEDYYIIGFQINFTSSTRIYSDGPFNNVIDNNSQATSVEYRHASSLEDSDNVLVFFKKQFSVGPDGKFFEYGELPGNPGATFKVSNTTKNPDGTYTTLYSSNTLPTNSIIIATHSLNDSDNALITPLVNYDQEISYNSNYIKVT